MKKIFVLLIILFAILLVVAPRANAQMMNNDNVVSVNPTDIQQQQQDETQGKQFLEQLQNNQTTCQKLSSSDFEKIGEYVMGQRFNNIDAHIQMNNNIKQMMGINGEENMHIKLGIVATRCNANEKGGGNFMMGYGGWNNIMGGWSGFGFGWIFMIIFWILVIFGVVALVRYLGGTRSYSSDREKTPLDILKERYAKGEIDKKEFEEMKKDLR